MISQLCDVVAVVLEQRETAVTMQIVPFLSGFPEMQLPVSWHLHHKTNVLVLFQKNSLTLAPPDLLSQKPSSGYVLLE